MTLQHWLRLRFARVLWPLLIALVFALPASLAHDGPNHTIAYDDGEAAVGYDAASVLAVAEEKTAALGERALVAKLGEFLAAETEAATFRVGEVLPDGRIAGNGPGAALRNGPDFSFRTGTPQEVYRRLETYHGIDPALASERLHTIKAANGFGAADNVVLDLTGNVYNPGTGEWLGSLTQGGKKFR